MFPTVESYPAKCWDVCVSTSVSGFCWILWREYLSATDDSTWKGEVVWVRVRIRNFWGLIYKCWSSNWLCLFVFIQITIVVFPMYPSLDKPNCWDTPQNHQHLLRSLGRPSAFSSQVHNIVTLLSGTAFIKTSKWLLKPPVQKYVSHWRITGNNLAENYNYPNMLMFSIIIPSK